MVRNSSTAFSRKGALNAESQNPTVWVLAGLGLYCIGRIELRMDEVSTLFFYKLMEYDIRAVIDKFENEHSFSFQVTNTIMEE
jgi:hypothetical protein